MMQNTVAPSSIVIIDDERPYRQGLRAELEPWNEQIAVVGEAANAHDAVNCVQEHVPDLVLIDLRLPAVRGAWSDPHEEHGIAAIAQIRQCSPTTRVLVLSHKEDARTLFDALRAGAHGYITKRDLHDEGDTLFHTIQTIIRDGAIFSPAIAKLMRDAFQRDHSADAVVERLTPREVEVLNLVADGKTNKEIAALLVIGEKTVKTHVSNVLAKLHVENRTEARYYVHFNQTRAPR